MGQLPAGTPEAWISESDPALSGRLGPPGFYGPQTLLDHSGPESINKWG